MSAELDAAIARMKARQPKDLIGAENLVSRFIAELAHTTRVLARGTVRTLETDHPGALIYDGLLRECKAIAASGPGGAICWHDVWFFWSNIPYESIAREVLAGPEGTVCAQGIETRSAIDAQRRGPQGESPVGNRCAQTTPRTPPDYGGNE